MAVLITIISKWLTQEAAPSTLKAWALTRTRSWRIKTASLTTWSGSKKELLLKAPTRVLCRRHCLSQSSWQKPTWSNFCKLRETSQSTRLLRHSCPWRKDIWLSDKGRKWLVFRRKVIGLHALKRTAKKTSASYPCNSTLSSSGKPRARMSHRGVKWARARNWTSQMMEGP